MIISEIRPQRVDIVIGGQEEGRSEK